MVRLIMKIKETMIKRRYCAYSFFLTLMIYAIICYMRSIMPFGDNTMLVHDMTTQYASFMSWYNDILLLRTPFWYSLRGGLGGSTAGLFAYYLSAPINLLLLFFDENTMPYGVMLLLCLKMGLSASSMQLLLDKYKRSPFSIVFSCFYALSSYAICYQFNIMWMDSYLLLPLVVYGLERLLEEEKGIFYAVMIGLSVLTNYYMGFMVCLFSVIYFIGHLIAGRYVNFKKALLNFILYSALGGGLSFAAVLPGVLTLKNSSSSRILTLKDYFDFSFIVSPIKALKYLFAGSFDLEQGIWGTYPMLYAGVFSVILVLILFLSKQYPMRKKLGRIVTLAAVFMGLFIRGAVYIWHGFSEPHGCSARNAFLWVFLVVMIAYEGLEFVNLNNLKSIMISIGIVIVVLTGFVFFEGMRIAFVADIFLIVMYIGFIMIYEKSSGNVLRNICIAGTIILCMAELAYNGVKLHEEEFEDRYLTLSTYNEDLRIYQELLNKAGLSYGPGSDDLGNIRAVILNGLGDSLNKGYAYNMNAISMYASSENMDTWDLYSNLGMGSMQYYSDSEYDGDVTEFISDILGVKYIIEDAMWPLPEYKEIAGEANLVLYENEYALPLAFLVNENAVDVLPQNYDSKKDLFKVQENIFDALVKTDDFDESGSIYEIIKEDAHVLDDYPDYMLRRNPRIFKLGDGNYTDGINIAVENREYLRDGIRSCADYTKSVNVNGKGIEAKVLAPGGSKEVMYTAFSIPYEDNFRVKVDGKVTKYYEGLGGMLLVPVSNGEHMIEVSYHTKGVIPGIIISSVCLVALLFIRKKRNIIV